MKNVEITYHKRPRLKAPIFIEGLPGVGNVGKLAAEHLVDTLKATKLADVYSKDLPPQVFVQEDGEVRLVSIELYYWKAKNKNQSDLVLMVGDFQPLSSEGQYDMVDAVLDILEKYECTQLYTLGGFGLGKLVQEPGVLGAATDKATIKELKKRGVQFKGEEPGGGIVGASGLFLGMGKLRGMHGACLMGETSGYLVDPKSARAVLNILSPILDIEIDYDELELKAQEMDRIAGQLREMERQHQSERGSDEIRYIG